ncbi:MAG: S66 peptidase family protein [Nakamurella sp.]
MVTRYPRPLVRGDRIGVTAPSAGVPAGLMPRLRFCVEQLRQKGYAVEVGRCMDGAGVVSAPARDRAAELTEMLVDPEIRAIVPPWGGDLAVEVLPYLDWDAIAEAEPTWLVGLSDISTLLLPLTTMTNTASLHGQNLLDTPYRVPAEQRSWLDVVSAPSGAPIKQSASPRHRSSGFDNWQDDPTFTTFTLDEPGGWTLLDPDATELHVSGRLIGGCIETVSVLAGTRYGDLSAYAREQAPGGLILYLEAYGDGAIDIARHLWRMRLAGWFDSANAIMIGRSHAPDDPGFTQHDAIRSALADLDLPVVLDVDCGHVPPHLVLVNGAVADLTVTATTHSVVQRLI